MEETRGNSKNPSAGSPSLLRSQKYASQQTTILIMGPGLKPASSGK